VFAITQKKIDIGKEVLIN